MNPRSFAHALRQRQSRLTSRIFIGLLTLVLLGATTMSTQAQEEPSPTADLEASTSALEEVGEYTFVAQVEQTLIPRPIPSNIGAIEEKIDSQLTGEVRLPDYTKYTWQFEAGADMPPVVMEQDGHQFFLLEGDQRTAIENPLTGFTPSSDFNTYIRAAQNIRLSDITHPEYTVYDFDINGAVIADLMVDELRSQLSPEQLATFNPDTSHIESITGNGQIFVNIDGLPQRQIVSINMPEVNQQYDAHTRFTIDYQYNNHLSISVPADETSENSGAISTSFITKATSRLTGSVIIETASSASSADWAAAIIATLAAIALTIALIRPNRKIRWLVPVSVTAVLILTPVLQPAAYAHQHRVAQASAPISLAEALGVADEAEAEMEAEAEVEMEAAVQTITNQSDLNACGAGETTADSDLDGLTDFVERCLGTNPYSFDTDNDGLTDTLEINGFIFTDTNNIPHTIYTNPHEADSNQDGLNDSYEWVDPGYAAEIDPDGDNLPNPWDSDNDGDLVPDEEDIDPFAVTDYQSSFSLVTTRDGDNFNGFQYIDIQVQPQDLEHLRLSTTALDWPYDEKGTLQARDLTNLSEVTFQPQLKVTTNKAPLPYLQTQYNVSVFEKNGGYEMQIPLMPVGDGGHITSFATRVVYASSQLDNINWSKVELVWTAMMDTSVDDGTRSRQVPIAEFTEPSFRITGLNITKNSAYDMAVIGTPAQQTDHRLLANTALGLTGAYLENSEFDFDSMVTRLNDSNATITETWGVPIANIAISDISAPHPDQSLVGLYSLPTLIDRFLQNNNYDTNSLASFIIATEGSSGIDGLDNIVDLTTADLSFSLANIPMQTARSVMLAHQQYNTDSWEPVEVVDVMPELLGYYDDDTMTSIQASLAQSYPLLSTDDLASVMIAFYFTWGSGLMAPVSYDAIDLMEQDATDEAITNEYHLPGETDFLTYLVEALNVAIQGQGTVIATPETRYQQEEINHSLQGRRIAMTSLYAGMELFGGVLRFDRRVNAKKWTDRIREFREGIKKIRYNIKYKREYNKLLKTLDQSRGNVVARAQKLAHINVATNQNVKQTGKKISTWGKIWKGLVKFHKIIIKVAATILQVAGLGLGLYTIWKTYKDFSSPYEFERDFALGEAIFRTIVDVIYTAVSLVGLLVAGFVGIAAAAAASIFGFVYLVIDLIGLIVKTIFPNAEIGDSLTATIFANIFIGDVQLKTELRDTDFEGTDVSFNRSGFALAGSTMTVSDQYRGRIEGFQYRDRLEQANTFAYFNASAGPNISVSTADTRFEYRRCGYSGSSKYCWNDLSAQYTFQNAGLDQRISFKYIIEADLEYTKYIFGGIRKVDKTENLVLPADLDEDSRWEAAVLYVDVLPATLDEFLIWNELTNHDQDADGVLDAAENDQALFHAISDLDGDGQIESLDWDSDGDGLSDGFEQSTANTLNASWHLFDSDNDALNDKKEYELDLDAGVSDYDSDGLFDGEEVYQWNGTSWNGGGWYINILGTNYWTFTDPSDGDRDGDNISDKSEKVNGTSPYAYNTAPALTLAAGPTLASNLTDIYVRNGDTVSATLILDNIGTSPISDTLSLCFPAAVTNLNVETGGDRQPVTQTNGNCREWDFSSTPLQLFQTFLVTMTGEATASTITGTITSTVSYNVDGTDTLLSQQVAYNQDNTAPAIFISDPVSNTILTSQYYVIGGNAADTDSYIDRVEVTVDTGTYEAVLTDADWGYTWQLPADGNVTITAVAYDAVGNASTADSVQVTVDTEAPQFTINLAENATISANEALSTTFPLNGTITDNRAGIDRVQLRYNDGNWRTIWDDSNAPLSTNWSGIWEIPTVKTAQGKHNLELRAYDIYGNVGTISRTVFIDVLPPTNELTNRAFIQATPRHVPAGSLDILGVASDAGNNPLPADPAELAGTLNSIEDATIWLQVDNLAENDAGATVNWIGDINGDRLGDLAVGLPGANGDTGRVVVVKGSPGDWPIPNVGDLEFLANNSPSYVGTAGAAIGSIIKPAGDVNGNGIDDFLIGHPANNQLILIMGSPSLEASNNTLDGSGSSEIILKTTNSDQSLTSLTANHIAAAGDVNNDGLDDILVSVTGITNTIYLVAGELPFNQIQSIDGRAAFKLDTGSTGASVAGVGDVNNDFIPDFAIAFGNNVYLFAGGKGWVPGGLTEITTADAIATFGTADALPTIVPTGDINGDNIADFAYSNGSTPVVVFGDSLATQNLSGFPVALSGFLSGVGDVDKDGRGDILVGNADGNAYLISGANLNTVAATIEGVESAASAPYVAGADLAGDGSSDLALVPSTAVAAALGYDGFGSTINAPFIPRSALPTSNPIIAPIATAPAQTLLPGDVIVATAGGDYTSIQAAIDSGATRVLIEPGIYEEAITLGSNVTLIGSGADRTILQVPVGITNTVFITADGVTDTAVLNLTILGTGEGAGLAVMNNATNIKLGRTVVQGLETAVSTDGSGTTLALYNNTIIGNVTGFHASSSAGVDIRNTIFAYNSGTALQYDGSAVLDLHQYNLYFANGTDMTPNNPGGGEIFSDPLFVDGTNGDFRTVSFSPVIDAGSPGDSVPPGAGSAVDIGHLEQGSFGFFVDGNYCSACTNDGLIWGVNAFNLIQDGVDAALADLGRIQLATPISFTVGVNEGAYTETVVISGSVNLVGRSPDTTAILGNGGPAVAFDAAVDAGISGFTLMGGGADKIGVLLEGGSNTVNINYNLIKHNTTGISVTERATGQATFNTIISNTTGVEIARGAIFNTEADSSRTLADSCYSAILCEERGFVWLDMGQNIIAHNDNGLVANGKSVVFSDNNLLFNTIDYTNVITGVNDITGQDPLLATANGYLTVSSPAIDGVVAKIAPPPGGGLAADIGWHELLAAPLSIFMGQPARSIATENVGVGQVEYAIVEVITPTLTITETLPTSWQTAVLDNPGEKLTYWRATVNATNDGSLYRVYSRAADLLGNTETDLEDWFDGAFYVDGTAPGITLTVNTNNSSFNFPLTWRLLELEVSDYIGNSFDISDVYFLINGERVDGQWRIDDWTADGSTPRVFNYLLRNNTFSFQNYTIEAVAIDGAGNKTTTSTSVGVAGGSVNAVNVDIFPPTFVTITNPIPGQFVDSALTIDIEALDADGYFCQFAMPVCESADSGVQGVEVSFDGGRSWSAAEFIGFDNQNINSLYRHTGWTPPANLDATTIPVRVRATDYFGLSTTSIVTITVDTAGPRLAGDYTYNVPIGTYLEYPTNNEVSVTLPPTLDGSGYTSRASFTYDSEGLPIDITVHSGQTATAYPSERISASFPIGVVDESLNFTGELIGSWHGAGAFQFVQSIKADGKFELEFGEWLSPTEKLDDDFRGNRTQTLWATWGFDGPFIGYEGASWGPDGQLWAYFDVYASKGSNQPISGTAVLPFAADVAFQAVDENNAFVWQFNDGIGQWEKHPNPLDNQPATDDFDFREYGHDPIAGTTEIHTYELADAFNFDAVNGLDTHRMMVYALDQNLNVFGAFPTANTLDGDFQHFYEWVNVQDDFDLLTLPTAAQQPAVELNITANPETKGLVTNNNAITFVADLTSIENDPVIGLQLQISATAGLNFQTVSGSTSYDCSAGDSCTIIAPAISAAASTKITITATTAGDLTGISAITTTASLEANLPVPASQTTLHHMVDVTPPTVQISPNDGNAYGVGEQVVFGSTYDANGVALVEVSTDGTTWTTAEGVYYWNVTINAPDSPTWQLYARATDNVGITSPITSITVIRDTTPPVITPNQIPEVIGYSVYRFTGTISDLVPDGARADSVEVQFDDPNSEWFPAVLSRSNTDDFYWHFRWTLPAEDGITHTVRFRGTDQSGNITTTPFTAFMVDSIPAQLTHDTDLSSFTVHNDTLHGTVTDGREVTDLSIDIFPTTGDVIRDTIIPNPDGTWQYELNQPIGQYRIVLTARDGVNNAVQRVILINARNGHSSDSQISMETIVNRAEPLLEAQTPNGSDLVFDATVPSVCNIFNLHRDTSPYFVPSDDNIYIPNPALPVVVVEDEIDGEDSPYFYRLEAAACPDDADGASQPHGVFTFEVTP